MSGSDPLFDTLFRSTTGTPAITSAAPVRASGTRSRAGNAMNRTRTALLDGAARAVAVSGTRITMAQVAAAAGVAKATLYNHFRTREAVLAALLEREIATLVAGPGDESAELPQRLAAIAHALSTHPVLRALAEVEPATLAGLAAIDPRADGWRTAAAALNAELARHGRGGGETVLRWLSSFLLSPGAPGSIAADLAIVLSGLPDAEAGDLAAAPPAGDAPASAARPA